MYFSLKKKRERKNQRKTIFYIHFYLNRKTMENTNSRFGRYLPLYRPMIKTRLDYESQSLIFAIRNRGSLGKPDSNDSARNFETSATTYRLRSEMQQPFRGNLLIGPRACSFASHAFTSISIDFLESNCFSWRPDRSYVAAIQLQRWTRHGEPLECLSRRLHQWNEDLHAEACDNHGWRWYCSRVLDGKSFAVFICILMQFWR